MMRGEKTGSRFSAVSSAAWLALFCVDVIGLLPWGHINFPIVDLAEMVYEVRRLQLGYVPYRDTFTHHYLGYILPLYVIGSIAGLTPLVLKITTVCFNFATAILVWLTLREVERSAVAWLGAFLAVTLGWFWSWQGFGYNVQSALAPIIAAVLFFVVRACARGRRSSLYAAALCCGFLAICDQRAVLFIALLAVATLVVPDFRRWRVVAATALSLGLVPAMAALVLWRAGAWHDFVEQTLLFPLLYRNHGVRFDLGAIVSTWFGTWLGGEPIALPLMFAGLVAVLVSERRRWLAIVCLTSVVCAGGYATMGGRAYPNYFMVFAPITLVLISLLPSALARVSPALARAATVSLAVFAVCCGLRPLLLWAETGSIFLARNEATIDAVADHLRATTTPADRVLVWGFAPQIYVLSDRYRTFKDEGLLSVAGANFVSDAGDAQARVPHMLREFDLFLTQDRPQAIVVYGVTKEPCPGKGIIQRNFDYTRIPALYGLRDAIASSYRSTLVVDGPCDRAEVFALKSSGQR